jgi:hypothetical protein
MSQDIVTAMGDLYGNVSFGGRGGGGGGGGGKSSASRVIACSGFSFATGAIFGAGAGVVTKNPWAVGGAAAIGANLTYDLCMGNIKTDWSSDR